MTVGYNVLVIVWEERKSAWGGDSKKDAMWETFHLQISVIPLVFVGPLELYAFPDSSILMAFIKCEEEHVSLQLV